MTITVYTKPDCFGCSKTVEKFEAAGIDFQKVDITQNPAALAYVTEELGYSQAPIVVIDDENHWAGLNPIKIEQAIARAAALVA